MVSLQDWLAHFLLPALSSTLLIIKFSSVNLTCPSSSTESLKFTTSVPLNRGNYTFPLKPLGWGAAFTPPLGIRTSLWINAKTWLQLLSVGINQLITLLSKYRAARSRTNKTCENSTIRKENGFLLNSFYAYSCMLNFHKFVKIQ